MQKNWYIIYTKPKREKKVASTLRKKKIENFLPLNIKANHLFKESKNSGRTTYFQSYVFAKVTESEY